MATKQINVTTILIRIIDNIYAAKFIMFHFKPKLEMTFKRSYLQQLKNKLKDLGQVLVVLYIAFIIDFVR
jgi:hypothetical protein